MHLAAVLAAVAARVTAAVGLATLTSHYSSIVITITTSTTGHFIFCVEIIFWAARKESDALSDPFRFLTRHPPTCPKSQGLKLGTGETDLPCSDDFPFVQKLHTCLYCLFYHHLLHFLVIV